MLFPTLFCPWQETFADAGDGDGGEGGTIWQDELTEKDYSLYQRLRLFHSMVTPTALYGAGSWAMTAGREQILRTTQRKMLRCILGKWRLKLSHDIKEEDSLDARGKCQSDNEEGEEEEKLDGDIVEELREEEILESWVTWKQRTTREVRAIIDKVRVPDWAEEQRRRLWRWAGHTARRFDGRWSKALLVLTPI